MFFKDKRTLVTGGAGFIGSHMIDRLVNEGAKVTCIDNLSAGSVKNLEQVIDEIEFIEGDIRNKTLIDKLTRNKDMVIHIAANASVPASVNNPYNDFESNVVGTFNILRAAVECNAGKVLYASSAAVYGNPIYIPVDEKHLLSPVSPYGATKLAGERMGFAYKKTYGLNFAAVRIFNTYGPRQPRYVMYDFVKKLLNNPKKLEVLGTGRQVRDYSYVGDTVAAMLIVAEKGEDSYNIAGGNPITIKELAEMMAKELAPYAQIEYGYETWKGDIEVLAADISKIKALGFIPKTDLKEGLVKMIEFTRKSILDENMLH
ncbi:MAG: SDR family NAD(P)-dependent oxidoreductase [Deltaproteobacteria bacterium]